MTSVRDMDKYVSDYENSSYEAIMVEYRRKKVLEIINKYKPKRILEIGCGFQSIANFYNDYISYTIVDPATAFCEKAKKDLGNKVNVINAFFEDSLEYIYIYDFILVSGVLCEVSDTTKFLNCLYKICNKETIVHINVPNAKSLHLLWAYKAGLIPHLNYQTEMFKKLQQYTIFDMDILSNLVEKHGFQILDKESYFIKPFNHSKMYDLVQNNIITKELLDGLYGLSEYLPEYGSEILVNCKIK